MINLSANKDDTTVGYSPADELYKKFGQGFVSALNDGVQIATGKKSGMPARELTNELKLYVEEARANEHR